MPPSPPLQTSPALNFSLYFPSLDFVLAMCASVLCEGAFGFVRVAQQRLSRELIAVKTFEKVRLRDSSSRRRLENEIRVLQRIRHPYIVRLYEVFESPKRIHLCMEHVSHGTLHRHLTHHKRLPEAEVRRLLEDVQRFLRSALGAAHSCLTRRAPRAYPRRERCRSRSPPTPSRGSVRSSRTRTRGCALPRRPSRYLVE